MTPTSKPPLYPKSHLLAASGVAAFLSFALLVFPSSDVEAKRTTLNLDMSSDAERLVQEKDDLRPAAVTAAESSQPFAKTTDNQTAPATASTPVDPLHKSVTVGNGDTLSTVFAKVGLSSNELHDVINSSKDAKRFSRLNVGQELQFELTTDGHLKNLNSKLSDLESISLSKTDKGYAFKRELVKPDVRSAYARGVINSSLFVSAKNAGLPYGLTLDMANVFGYDIDFAQDIVKGDQFEVIYEEKVVEGKVVGTGNILAARFTNRGKAYTAVRFTNKQGSSSYYNAQGMSLRKAFLRTPVDFARISSRFSSGRRHPILNKIRAHQGVDYAAPRGTPIRAAGDGKVILAGRKGGYGNTVILRHGNSYQTLYAHMNGFAKGIRNGAPVKQGQVIGYIGTTGLSTGPHLHYEFQINGRHVDPLAQKKLMADPIASTDKAKFIKMSQPLMARMDQEKSTALAVNRP